MKRKYLIIGTFACMQYFAHAQLVKDTVNSKLNKTEIELVYNQYIQNGNNSAVTGGIGTEKLTVYGPALNFKNTSGKNAISINGGADVISSASTDNIDFVVSSASRVDTRVYISGDYERNFAKQNLKINGGLGSSIESDYFSISGNLGLTKSDKNNNRSFSAQLLIYDDDLRWGRTSVKYYRPVKLIYPAELRFRNWFDIYKRYSFNLKLSFTQILNKRNTLGIFPEISYQKGLLSTPFNRIYFSDGKEAVENLPNNRYKAALALKLNTFVGGIVIFKNTVNVYIDNFGILALSFGNETAIKVKPFLTLLPNFRIYTQRRSDYFAPYKVHESSEEFYTSDYDLSSFQTYNFGFGFKYSPQKYTTHKFVSNSILFRYDYYFRTNKLRANIISLVIQKTILHKKSRKSDISE
jgi:hypothetical protein